MKHQKNNKNLILKLNGFYAPNSTVQKSVAFRKMRAIVGCWLKISIDFTVLTGCPFHLQLVKCYATPVFIWSSVSVYVFIDMMEKSKSSSKPNETHEIEISARYCPHSKYIGLTEKLLLLKYRPQAAKTHLFTSMPFQFDSIRFDFSSLISKWFHKKNEFHTCLLIFLIMFDSIHTIFHAHSNWAHARALLTNPI